MDALRREYLRRPSDTSSLFLSEGLETRLKVGSEAHFLVLLECTEPVPLASGSAGTLPSMQSSCSASTEGPMPLLTLRVSASSSADGVPIIRSGATIEGDVTLLVQRDQKFKDVSVRIRGCTVAPQMNKIYFLDVEQSLMPQWAGLTSTYLKGRHVLPFNFAFPDTCNRTHTGCPLPPTFSSRGQPLAIQYSISAKVRKTGLRADEQVTLAFLYLPRTRPTELHTRHDLDYGTEVLKLAPSSDVLLWGVSSKQISAVAFGERTVLYDCTFALANAPVYTRGTFISYRLSIETWDAPALELLATPTAVQVSFVRHIMADIPLIAPSSGRLTRYTEVLGAGSTWVQPGHDLPTRVLRGEIALRRDLKPHFSFPPLSVIYAVVVSFKTSGFHQTNRLEDHVFVIPVGIATDVSSSILHSATSSSALGAPSTMM